MFACPVVQSLSCLQAQSGICAWYNQRLGHWRSVIVIFVVHEALKHMCMIFALLNRIRTVYWITLCNVQMRLYWTLNFMFYFTARITTTWRTWIISWGQYWEWQTSQWRWVIFIIVGNVVLNHSCLTLWIFQNPNTAVYWITLWNEIYTLDCLIGVRNKIGLNPKPEFVFQLRNDKNMKDMDYDVSSILGVTNLTSKAGLFARGFFNVLGPLTLMVSLVNLQGYTGWCCSPCMKSSSLSQNITATLDVLYFPFPFVTWSVQTKSCMQNSPSGGFWTLLLNSLIRSAWLAWNATGSVSMECWSGEGNPASAIAQRRLLESSSVWAFTTWGVEIGKEISDCHQTLNYLAVIPTLNHLLWRHPVYMSLIMLELVVSTPQNAKHATRWSSSSIRKTLTVVFSKKSCHRSAHHEGRQKTKKDMKWQSEPVL